MCFVVRRRLCFSFGYSLFRLMLRCFPLLHIPWFFQVGKKKKRNVALIHMQKKTFPLAANKILCFAIRRNGDGNISGTITTRYTQ